MFRAQANPMDESVVKATDENLTSENWELILDVCDRVSATSSGPANAVSALIKRLAHRNANVQLYTLELAHALAQNCGAPLHRELASKAFTDALLRLAGDRNTHAQVKQKVLGRMGSWAEMFSGDADLGIMAQAYQRLRQSQPGLMPPSKPGKREISGEDRRKEEEELQMALALSVQDKGGSGGKAVGSPDVGRGAGGVVERDDGEVQGGAQQQQQQQQGTTAATVSRVRALYDFTPSEPGELAFRRDDVIAVLESVYKDWWKGSLRGQTGIFPLNYVEKLQDPTKEELERDAQMEADVFGEIRNVEKLLALLSVRDGGSGRRGEREEEEIAELYQRTLGIRPKLIELIGKYSQKKDDFTQLNEKFIKARRDYEALLESSMAQPQAYQQQYPIRTPHAAHSMLPPLQQQHQQQRQPYAAQPAGYAPHLHHQHPQQQPQDPQQRFYSPGPSDQTQGYGPGSAYPPHPNAGPPPPPTNGGGAPTAPFHFIPGGVGNLNAPPPASPLQPQYQQQQNSQPIHRRPSSPPQPQSQPNGAPPPDLYAPPPQQQQQHPTQQQQQQQQQQHLQPLSAGGGGAGGGFQGQIRPNSIHTLNSGNPQELAATAGVGAGGDYESPVATTAGPKSGSYPPSHFVPSQSQQLGQQQGAGGYDPYAQQQQQQQQPQVMHSERDPYPPSGAPLSAVSQTGQGFESSPTSLYSQQTTMDAGGAGGLPQQQQQQQQQAYQAYQAYQPAQVQVQGQGQGQGQQGVVGGGGGGEDPGDYYR